MSGEQDRMFGTWKPSIVEAMQSFTDNYGQRIALVEQERLLAHADAMQKRRDTLGRQLQAHDGGDASPVASSQITERNGVEIVHQIYGLFGDGKPMSPLFQKCQRKWQRVAEAMSAKYVLWDAAGLEALVCQRYPQYWKTYKAARYPVMRVDMGRLMILYSCGGLYADLDVEPNRKWYEQVDLALPRVKDPKRVANPDWDQAKMTKRRRITGDAESYLDMEVIVGREGNEIFIRWLDYMMGEIKDKAYRNKKSFWYNARMRYIYNTTGPACLNRFLGLPSNAEWLAAKNLTYLECNHFKEAHTLTWSQKRKFDVISHESNSYFTDKLEIHVPVGDGKGPLPSLKSRRIQEAHSPAAGSAESDVGAQPVVHAVADPRLGQLQAEKDALEKELQVSQDRTSRFREHCYQHRRSGSTKVFLESMPKDLADWITAGWPHD